MNIRDEILEKELQQHQVCLKIYNEVYRAILIEMRFLDTSLNTLRPSLKPNVISSKHREISLQNFFMVDKDTVFIDPSKSCATDGKELFFVASEIINKYKESFTIVIHDTMHVLLHCIFRHLFLAKTDNPMCNLAFDIIVEYLIYSFDRNLFNDGNESRVKKLKLFESMGISFTPANILQTILCCDDLRDDITILEKLFAVDDHSLWYKCVDGIGNEIEECEGGNKSQENLEEDSEESSNRSDPEEESKESCDENSQKNVKDQEDSEGESEEQRDEEAFYGCKSLIELSVSKRLNEYSSYNKKIFYQCESLADEQGLIIVGGVLYEYIGDLEIVKIPESVKIIGVEAFNHCQSLKEVYLPKSVEKIERNAFDCCNNLSKIEIKSQTCQIGNKSFGSCVKSLNFFYVTNSIFKKFENDVKYYCLKNALAQLSHCTKEQKDELIAIFKRRKILKMKFVFEGNYDIIKFLFSYRGMFSLLEIDKCVDYYNKKNNTTIVAMMLQYKNEMFTKKQLQVYQVNKDLVEACLELPTYSQFKEKWNFYYVRGGGMCITSYIGENDEEIIPEQLMSGVPIVEIDSTNNILYLEWSHPFKKLKKITIKAKIKEVSKTLFNNFKTLEEIYLPSTVTKICDRAFYNCSNLVNVYCEGKIEEIEMDAFSGCSKLENIYCDGKIDKIGVNAFSQCTKLAKEQDFIIFQNILLQYIGLEEIVTIPEDVEKIDENAFTESKHVKKIFWHGNEVKKV